jgi:signal transduction histidine kinase
MLLVALTALATLPVLAFALWLLQVVWQNGQQEARRDLQQMAATLAVALDREIAGSVRELQRLAEYPSIEDDGFVRFHAHARHLVARNDGWENIALTEPDGRVAMSAAMAAPGGGSLHADQPHLREVLARGLPAVSDVYRSPRTGDRAIAVSVPVMRDGAVRWVLSARLSSPQLSRFVGEQLYRDGAVAAAIDRQLQIVARNRDGERFFGHPITEDLRTALLASPERGILRLTTLDGARVLAAWQRMPSGWTMTIGVPVDVFDAPLRRSIGVLLGFGLAVLAAGVVVSRLLAGAITGVVESVGCDARALAAGEPIEPAARSSIRQIDALYASLREASRLQRDKERAREQAVAALREADRRKDEFLAMLAHELRNPLAPLRNAIALLSRTLGPGTAQRQSLEMADRQVRQLTRLVDDLLDVSRITQGKITLHREQLAVCAVVAEAVEAIRPVVEQRGQRLSLRLPPESPTVRADPLRLAQVLENLLSNASKYTDPGGAIDVEVEAADDEVAIRVRDTGIGLPPEQLERVFELFTQVDAGSDRTQGGLGIGLSLVRQLVAMHGGRVTAHSDGPGRGACFVVRLPREAATIAA